MLKRRKNMYIISGILTSVLLIVSVAFTGISFSNGDYNLALFFILMGYLYIRTQYAMIAGLNAGKAIKRHMMSLFKKREYDWEVNDYYEELGVNIFRLIFLNIFEFSRFGGVKKEYVGLLKPYFD